MTPVIPPPTTATWTRISPARGGWRGAVAVSAFQIVLVLIGIRYLLRRSRWGRRLRNGRSVGCYPLVMKLARKVCVAGVGMTRFHKPGTMDYPVLTREAGEAALADAGVRYDQIEQAYVGYVYGDSTSGQRAIYQLGMTGIPVYNVNNNCSTGSTALMLAYQAVGSGVSDCALALGFEKMEKGSLTTRYGDRTNPLDRHVRLMNDVQGAAEAPFPAQMFGGAGREHMRKYGTTSRQLGQDRRQEPATRRRQRTLPVPAGLHHRGGPGLARHLRSAHQVPVLPHHRWGGGGGGLLGGVRPAPWPASRR